MTVCSLFIGQLIDHIKCCNLISSFFEKLGNFCNNYYIQISSGTIKYFIKISIVPENIFIIVPEPFQYLFPDVQAWLSVHNDPEFHPFFQLKTW